MKGVISNIAKIAEGSVKHVVTGDAMNVVFTVNLAEEYYVAIVLKHAMGAKKITAKSA